MMNVDILKTIRMKLSPDVITDAEIEKVLYTTPGLLNVHDRSIRHDVVKALGYDPEDKWK